MTTEVKPSASGVIYALWFHPPGGMLDKPGCYGFGILSHHRDQAAAEAAMAAAAKPGRYKIVRGILSSPEDGTKLVAARTLAEN